MADNKRFTIMTFPQSFDGVNLLKVNILFLPRSQNPFKPAIEATPPISDPVAPFVDATMQFNAAIIRGTNKFPNTLNADIVQPCATIHPLHKKTILNTLKGSSYFNIENKDDSNQILNDKTNVPKKRLQSIKKYLPQTYRQAFNFIAPKLKGNGVTDDSYHCAVRDAKPFAGFKQSPDTVSWGKVFAHILRNPLLAEAAGFIYKTSVEIDVKDFEQGGWLYVDLENGSDYSSSLHADQTFIKRYAARIPQLKAGSARPIFAANLFPVLIKNKQTDPEPPAPGNFDNVFIEAADYDDGFGKILHSFQPVSQHLLQEKSDGFHPTHDSGIRLGWDDEQILQWYVRQMAEDDATPGVRLDAPTGVMGFHIDVKLKEETDWSPLNKVITKNGVDALGGLVPDNPPVQFSGELPFQVYPSTLDGDPNKNYWLPLYFANWTGHSMVLPNKEAIEIYQHDKSVLPDTTTNVGGSPKNQLLKVYDPVDLKNTLQYGNTYDFRIRYTDITNGGPTLQDNKINDALKPVTTCTFKRYVAPSCIRINDIPANDDGAVYDKPSLIIKRPLLSYPAVVYTNKYTNAVARILSKIDLQMQEAAVAGKRIQINDVGLSDPNVDAIEILVEVQALQMDYQLSKDGKESYARLYKTIRKFNDPVTDDDYDADVQIPLQYVDAGVLKFGNTADFGDLGFTQLQLDEMKELVIPTARNVRLTIRAVCEEKAGYYGLENANEFYNTRYGRTINIQLYKPSDEEINLFSQTNLQGIYLQPDKTPVINSMVKPMVKVYAQPAQIPDAMQRLAQQIKIENNGMSLVGKKGQRIQFGCSSRIRHTLSPDNSSLTLAGKAELHNHWLSCIVININRDWTWNALQDLAFVITRKKWFKSTPLLVKEEVVGEIEMKHSISLTALQNADRTYTKLVFIDAVEPKKEQSDSSPDFPDLLIVEYTVKTIFKKDHATVSKDNDLIFPVLQLPVTTNPVQIPKIASAGIALSPYQRNDRYSTTEPRRRFLWIEFTEPVKDPNDLYFARVLSYSPDQLLSNNHPSLENSKTDSAINLDPENIRVIMPGTSDDSAGIDAMQPMEKSLLSDRHYLLPLPSGLHESSPELFGFFTYEFRVGHAKIWSTAQARFGRPLKATGIQHPAPTLICSVNRDEEKLYVTAPYAIAVADGKNVTAKPPRTQLWCLLYAQVKQADNNDKDKELKDYRNILLEDRFMHWSYKIKHNEKKYLRQLEINREIGFNDNWMSPVIDKNMVLKKMNIKDININYIQPVSYADIVQKNQDSAIYGSAFWSNKEIEALLNDYGLPQDLSLSVLCVEVFSNITNENEFRTKTGRMDDEFISAARQDNNLTQQFSETSIHTKPLSSHLGNYRILRTSPLVEVPFVCCTE